MNRELKFRVWSERLNKMVYFTLQELLLSYNDEDNYCHLADTDLFNIHQDIDVDGAMQFTGLKDKTGKEIYEGDIVRSSSSSPYVVEWNSLSNGDYEAECWGWILYHYPNEVEVIGNIYENPHLINKAG